MFLLKSICFPLIFLSLFTQAQADGIRLTSTDLSDAVKEYMTQTFEAQAISELLETGNTLFIMGSGATSIALAVQEHLKNRDNPGSPHYRLPEKFTDLLHHSQDLDFVLDNNFEAVKTFKARMDEATWNEDNDRIDVITLHEENGRGIFGVEDWQNQNSDLSATGLVYVTTNQGDANQYEGIINTRHIKKSRWGFGGSLGFVDVITSGENRYFDSDGHFTTFLTKRFRNPKIVSALKFLSNNLRFGFTETDKDADLVKGIISDFTQELQSNTISFGEPQWADGNRYYVLTRLHMTVAKMVKTSRDIQRTAQVLRNYKVLELMRIIESEIIDLEKIDPLLEKKLSPPLCVDILAS